MPPDALIQLNFAGGLMAGFASSLHCVGMCGGLASGLMFSLSAQNGTAARAQALAWAQLGRVLAYLVAGLAVGAVGSSVFIALDREIAHLALRWAGGAMLVYIGMSVAGWAPGLAGLDRLAAGFAGRAQRALSISGPAAPLAAGFAWGAMPCGMVYAALLYAMMTGSAQGGALVMAGFGLGTLPAVTAAAFGAHALLGAARSGRTRIAVALTIIVLGFASAAIPWRVVAEICGLA